MVLNATERSSREPFWNLNFLSDQGVNSILANRELGGNIGLKGTRQLQSPIVSNILHLFDFLDIFLPFNVPLWLKLVKESGKSPWN